MSGFFNDHDTTNVKFYFSVHLKPNVLSVKDFES